MATGCSHWGRRPVNELKPIDPDAPVWIWTKGGVEKWHWVEITRDSVLGVPLKSHGCVICDRSIPRTQVDSMKVGYVTWVERIVDSIAVITLTLLLLAPGPDQ